MIRQLVINVIDTLMENAFNAGCNDLFDDDPLLKHIARKELERKFKRVYGEELTSDIQLLEYIKELVDIGEGISFKDHKNWWEA